MNEYYFYYDTDESSDHCFVTIAASSSEAAAHFYHEVIESEGPNGSDRADIHLNKIGCRSCVFDGED